MTVQQFNNAPRKKKWKFIKDHIGLQNYGKANVLALPTMIIFFECKLPGILTRASSEPMPQVYLDELQKEFPGFECILFNHNPKNN